MRYDIAFIHSLIFTFLDSRYTFYNKHSTVRISCMAVHSSQFTLQTKRALSRHYSATSARSGDATLLSLQRSNAAAN